MQNRTGRTLAYIFMAAFFSAGLASCKGKGGAVAIQEGSQVKMHYKLTVGGQVIDQSKDAPLPFVAGKGQMIPGVDKAVIGMKAGDKKSLTVSPEDGYGPKNPAAVQKVPKKMFKDADSMKVGSMVQGQTPQGPFRALIIAVGPDEVTLDLNHPLAGKTLNFELEIIEVLPPAAS